MKAWFVVYTKPRQEDTAKAHLQRQHYDVYLPKSYCRSVRKRRRIESLFPRYLFLRLDTESDNWGPIRSTRGVSHLVSFGGQPAYVPDGFVRGLKSNEDEGGVQRWIAPDYVAGDRVLIAEGLFAGYEAVCSALSGHQRVLLLLELAGSSLQVETKTDHIEPLSV